MRLDSVRLYSFIRIRRDGTALTDIYNSDCTSAIMEPDYLPCQVDVNKVSSQTFRRLNLTKPPLNYRFIMVPPIISLEEHFDSKILKASDDLHANLPNHLQERLQDLGELRINDLDSGGVSLQIISHIGVLDTPVEGCIQANDKLAAACRRHPDRFKGFATLPMQDPHAAAEELQRTVKEYGFVGALINNTCEDGAMYDDEKYWPVFERAVELDVPIYIHPSYPASNLSSHYNGNFSTMSAIMMSTAGWGW